MNKTVKIIGSVVIAIIIIVFLCFGVRSCNASKGNEAESNAKMEFLRDSIKTADQINKLNDSIGKLNFLLDDCRGNKKPAPVIAKKPTAKVVRVATPPPPPAQKPKVDYTREPAAVVAVTSKKVAQPTARVAQDKYLPDYVGDYGVTINEYMEIVYYLSDKLLTSGESKPTLPAPLLYENNPRSEFQYDRNTGFWTYASGEIVQEALLLEGYTLVWNVYIGINPQWNYPMFIPHELAKLGSSWTKAAVKAGLMVQHLSDVGWDWHTKVTYKVKQYSYLINWNSNIYNQYWVGMTNRINV